MTPSTMPSPRPLSAPLRLDRSTRLQGLQNRRISAVQGPVWLTLDNDPRDTVLGAGESYTVPSNAALLIGPLRGGTAFEVLIEDLS